MKNLALTFAITIGTTFSILADDAAPAVKLPPPSTKANVTYAKDIQPIFEASCVKCHNSKKKKQGAKLSLDTLAGALKGSRDGKVIIPGDSAKSDLVLSIAHATGDHDSFMPKGRDAKKLSDEQIGLIRAWIDQGAK